MRFTLDRLPGDPILLQRMLREAVEAIGLVEADLEARDATLKTQGLRIEKLEHEVARLRRLQHGRSSERQDIDQLRLLFEDPAPANDDEVHSSVAPKSPPRRGARAPLSAALPRRTIDHIAQRKCDCTGPLAEISSDVTEVLNYIPARFEVLRHCRPRLACRRCERIVQAPAPALPIPKARASSPLLAHMIVSRFADHQPWHRQEMIFRRLGADIDRDLMAAGLVRSPGSSRRS